MPEPADTVIDVRTLIDKPGATRSLDRSVVAPTDMSDDIVRLGSTVTVDAIIESVVDGLLVRGVVAVPVRLACPRCLAERDGHLRADVVELFGGGDEADEDAGYGIVDSTIDLDTMIRDALAAVAPLRPLCRPDCAGLCPTCGADRNVAPCDGHPEDLDARWAPLADLELPDTH